MDPTTKEDRDIQRKLKALRYAQKIGDVAKACRYFGVGRSSFYRWKAAYEQRGEVGLVNAKPIPKNPANQTPPEIVDKVLYLRSKYHLGSIRIVWYLARYHGIKISDAGVTRIPRRNDNLRSQLSRLQPQDGAVVRLVRDQPACRWGSNETVNGLDPAVVILRSKASQISEMIPR